MDTSIRYFCSSSRRQELLNEYFVGISYDKSVSASGKGPIDNPDFKDRSVLSRTGELIKIWKAFPIRNPRADLRPSSDLLFYRSCEEPRTSVRTSHRFFFYEQFVHKFYEQFVHKLQSYDVIQSRQEPLFMPAVCTRYTPSILVAKAFLKASEQVAEDFRKSLYFVPTKLLRPSKKPNDVLLREISEAIGEVVQGALQTLAYRAAAFEAKIAQVSNSQGDFVEPFKRILYECMPVKMSDIQWLFKTLQDDLEFFASKNPVLARWGSLHNGPAGLFVRVTVVLPTKPAAGDSVVVGGIKIT